MRRGGGYSAVRDGDTDCHDQSEDWSRNDTAARYVSPSVSAKR